MSTVIAILAVFILSLLIASCSRAEKKETDLAAVTAKSTRAMSKEEIRKALGKIERSAAPNPKMSAMCYDMAMPPSTVDYLCPVCGTKTHYANVKIAYDLGWNLEACRRLADTIRKSTGADLSLDESAFCPKCARENTTPELAVIVKFQDGSSKRTSPVSVSDLRLLEAFFSGELVVEEHGVGISQPLKNSLPRLRELLGEEKGIETK